MKIYIIDYVLIAYWFMMKLLGVLINACLLGKGNGELGNGELGNDDFM